MVFLYKVVFGKIDDLQDSREYEDEKENEQKNK